jgi:hypothetical protein
VISRRLRVAAVPLVALVLVADAAAGLSVGRWLAERSAAAPDAAAASAPREREPDALRPGLRPADRLQAEAKALLDRRAAAVLAADAAGYLSVFAARPELQAQQAAEFAALTALGPSAFRYELLDAQPTVDALIATEASVQARLSYRIGGVDRSDAVVAAPMAMVLDPGGWRLAGDEPADGLTRSTQIWQYGPLEVVRGSRSVVVGLAGAGPVGGLAPRLDAAWGRVESVWGAADADGALMIVPGRSEQLGALLGTDPSGWSEVAALTSGGPGGVARLYLNPATLERLGPKARGIVLAHELTHVVTRAPTSLASPLWLKEGFADYVGFTDSGVALRIATSEGLEAVRRSGTPDAWPPDADFTAGSVAAPAAYALGHLACRAIAERYGREALVAFYRAVDAGAADPAANVAAASRSVLGVEADVLLASWRSDVASLAG